MISASQAQTAKAIVNIFETGQVLGDYSTVTLIDGDTGQLTYGRAQTTLTSGGLNTLIRQYCALSGALFADSLLPYLERLANADEALNQDRYLHNLLRASADDPLMRDAQDAFFDEQYWDKAVKQAQREGITTPLGYAIVYDSTVHGSWQNLRNSVNQDFGSVEDRGEEAWLTEYVNQRYQWLSQNRRANLRAALYRMKVFQQLISSAAWGLPLPLVVRGQEISIETLAAAPQGVYAGPSLGSRLLAVATPLMRGRDVRQLQLALSALNYSIVADGIYGAHTSAIVKEFQTAHELLVTGHAGIDELVGLGLLG